MKIKHVLLMLPWVVWVIAEDIWGSIWTYNWCSRDDNFSYSWWLYFRIRSFVALTCSRFISKFFFSGFICIIFQFLDREKLEFVGFWLWKWKLPFILFPTIKMSFFYITGLWNEKSFMVIVWSFNIKWKIKSKMTKLKLTWFDFDFLGHFMSIWSLWNDLWVL